METLDFPRLTGSYPERFTYHNSPTGSPDSVMATLNVTAVKEIFSVRGLPFTLNVSTYSGWKRFAEVDT